MADYAIHDTTLTDIANKIRKKDGTSALIDPADYADRIDLMGMLEVKSVSSALVSISDGADDVPLKDLVFSASPVQASGIPMPSNPLPVSEYSELNGYHTGKNMIKPDKYQASATLLMLGQTNDTAFETFLKAGTYTISYSTTGESCYIYLREANDGSNTNLGKATSKSFTTSDDGHFRFWLYGDGAVSANISDVQLEAVSSKTAFQAYSGETHKWTFPPFGKNLANIYAVDSVTMPNNATITQNNDGTLSITTTTQQNVKTTKKLKEIANLTAGETYFLSATSTGSQKQIYLHESATLWSFGTSKTITQAMLDSYVSFYASGNNTSAVVSDFQIEAGSSATAYEPFQKMYSGSVNALTGQTISNWKKIVFDGSEEWGNYPNYNGYYIGISDMKSGNKQDGLCNMLVKSTSTAQGQTNSFWLGVGNKNFYLLGVYDSMGATLEAFKAFLSAHPLEVYYPADETIYKNLESVAWKSKLGVNNFYNDCGNTETQYRSSGTVYTYPSGEGVSF